MSKKNKNKDKKNEDIANDTQFIREVNEDIQSERVVNFFKNNMFLILGLFLLVVTIVGSREVYKSYLEKRNVSLANQFEDATNYSLAIIGEENIDIDLDNLKKITNDIDDSGYKVLLNYFLAHQLVKEGKIMDAVTHYEYVYKSSNAIPELRAVSRIRAGFLLIGVDFPRLKNAVEGLAKEKDSRFKDLAMEVLATGYLFEKDFGAASSYFNELQSHTHGNQGAAIRIRNLKHAADLKVDIKALYNIQDNTENLSDLGEEILEAKDLDDPNIDMMESEKIMDEDENIARAKISDQENNDSQTADENPEN